MQKIIISASSMPAGRNMSSQLDYIQKVQAYGADMYHLDVMDGVFVKNQTLDYTYFPELKRKSSLLFDVHLMISTPERYIKKYINAGADILTIHCEAFEDDESLIEALKLIKKIGAMAGICIDLHTSADDILRFLKYVDLVLVMSVKAGSGGQKFDETALQKIKQIRKINPKILISVDGGIDDTNCQKAVKAGADILVSGTYIFENDAFTAIEKLKGK